MRDQRSNFEGFADAPGGRLWYRVDQPEQTGNTPLLVIHGGPGMSHNYLLGLLDLADERPVIFYDQLDAGKSERPNDPANWVVGRFVDEIDALRDHLGLDEVAVFGNSWGGSLAAEYAMRRPPGLKAAILSSPLLNTTRWIADNTVLRNELPKAVLDIMDRCEAIGESEGGITTQAYFDATEEFYRRHFCRVDPWPDGLNATFEVINAECYGVMWGPNEFTCSGALNGYDITPQLPQINVPVLMTCGEYDEARPATCREYAAHIPDARVIEFADCSHTAFIEKTDDYTNALRSFLTTLKA